MRIRMVSFAVICSSLSLVHLFVAFRQLQQSNIIEVWLLMKDRVARHPMVAFGVEALILASIFLGILPPWLLLLLNTVMLAIAVQITLVDRLTSMVHIYQIIGLR